MVVRDRVIRIYFEQVFSYRLILCFLVALHALTLASNYFRGEIAGASVLALLLYQHFCTRETSLPPQRLLHAGVNVHGLATAPLTRRVRNCACAIDLLRNQ